LQAHYCWQPDLARMVTRELSGKNGKSPYDIVHVEHLRGVRYALDLKRHMPGVPVIWDSVDCISLLFRQAARESPGRFNRLMTRLDLQRTEGYERQMLDRFDRLLVTSPLDQEAFAAMRPGESRADQTPTLLQNGVDLEYFRPLDDQQREPATLVISGKMSYHANASMVLNFVEHIFPLILEKRPDVRLWVVGKEPPKRIVALAQHPAITVTGTVPDIRPYLQRATAAVVPLTYGAGIQNKVLEAFACGTPVVSTPRAVAALNVETGRELLVAQDPEAFAAATIGLLEDTALQRRLGAAGRRYVEERHSWEKIAEQLEGIYYEVIGRSHE